mmetsp:Transcript_16873/g.34411  ORF Transcript_16873/g.34411 Transcript_16873/m.34411 type:complete len:228 (+) Transcript_16873:683-1366(+)
MRRRAAAMVPRQCFRPSTSFQRLLLIWMRRTARKSRSSLSIRRISICFIASAKFALSSTSMRISTTVVTKLRPKSKMVHRVARALIPWTKKRSMSSAQKIPTMTISMTVCTHVSWFCSSISIVQPMLRAFSMMTRPIMGSKNFDRWSISAAALARATELTVVSNIMELLTFVCSRPLSCDFRWTVVIVIPWTDKVPSASPHDSSVMVRRVEYCLCPLRMLPTMCPSC